MNPMLDQIMLLSLFLLLVQSEGKVFTIPERWSVSVNNTNSPEFQGDGRSGSYRMINSPQGRSFMVSENQDFGLAFLNFNGTNKFYLALMFGTRNSYTAAPIWIANRDAPVDQNSVLVRAPNGRLQLLHPDRTLAWSSGASIGSVSIPDTGNLELYDDSNTSVWSFFNHPENVLLPDQKMVTGQALVSNKNSSDPSRGPLIIRVEPSGLVAYMNFPSRTEQAYLLWGFTGSTVSSVTGFCSGFRTAIRLTPRGSLVMEYEPVDSAVDSSKQPCGSPIEGHIFSGNTTTRYYLFDGLFNSYRRESTNGSWINENLYQYFQPPIPCGDYGLFESGKECRCLSVDAPGNSTRTTSGSCSRPEWASSEETCSTRYETSFVSLAGVSYLSTQYYEPNRTGSLRDCLGDCKSTCSCAALFYDRARQNCFYIEDVLGSLTVDPSKQGEVIGFLKFQNQSRLAPVAREPDSKTPEYIAIGVISGVAGVAIISFVVVYLILRRRKAMVDETKRFLTSVEASPFQFSYRCLYSATRGFTKVLGTGGGGVVYEGALVHDGMKLAVKKLSTDHAQRSFIAEVQALGSISHINIVKLYGFCADGSHRLLVYEFMPRGSLDTWIFSERRGSLDWKRRYSIALGTARGLAYLHEETRDRIIHLDIKPQNILLGESFEAKVADFGMAKLVMNKDGDDSGVVTRVRGTPGYLAPEWLVHGTATDKCDVYSYGMVLLEMIGGRRNTDLSKGDEEMGWYFPAWAMREVQRGDAMRVVDGSVRDSADENEARNLIHTALWCVQEDPGARPNMKEVARMLESREVVQVPPLGFHFLNVQEPGILTISHEPGISTYSYLQGR